MVVVRPVVSSDLDSLEALAALTGVGLTTLPQDRDYLAKRIRNSERAIDAIPDKPGGESYLFVMEDREPGSDPARPGRIIGTSGVISKVGGFEPFYAYRVETSVHESAFLGVRKEIKTLHLVAEHNGPCEVCSLFLSLLDKADVHDVFQFRLILIGTIGDGADFIAGTNNSFCPQKANCEIEIVAGRPHCYSNAFAIHPNFERLFHDDFIFDMLQVFLIEFQHSKSLQIMHRSAL